MSFLQDFKKLNEDADFRPSGLAENHLRGRINPLESIKKIPDPSREENIGEKVDITSKMQKKYRIALKPIVKKFLDNISKYRNDSKDFDINKLNSETFPIYFVKDYKTNGAETPSTIPIRKESPQILTIYGPVVSKTIVDFNKIEVDKSKLEIKEKKIIIGHGGLNSGTFKLEVLVVIE